MSEHDEDVRINQVRKFLSKGNKVKIELNLRGREHRHKESAQEKIENFIERIKQDTTLQVDFESPIKRMGGKFMAIILNKSTK